MKFYCAPMEGLTTFPFRQVHHRFFPGVDKYFTPFLVANQTLHFKRKEIRELLPENNKDICTVPQVLSNKAEEFLWAVRAIQQYGYSEINLNLGCPSPTVVTRGRGAGFLADPDRLDRFFDAVFQDLEADPDSRMIRISVKTRTGLTDHAEAGPLMKIFNRYPIHELIIHPRRRIDLYKGQPDREVFGSMMAESVHPVCYNGDIRSIEDYLRMKEAFPECDAVMIGRGLIRDPSLIERIREEIMPEETKKQLCSAGEPEMHSRLWDYQLALYHAYHDTIESDRDVIAKMKELWSYMGDLFPGTEKNQKQIRKAWTYEQYLSAVSGIFSDHQDGEK